MDKTVIQQNHGAALSIAVEIVKARGGTAEEVVADARIIFKYLQEVSQSVAMEEICS